MNCHIVPKCYLKSWKTPNTNRSIYIFEKSKTRAKNNNKNIDNLSDTNFAFEDKYLIDIFNKDYMYKFHDDFFDVMSELKVTANYNGTKISSITDYMDNLDNIDKWIYLTNDGTAIDSSVVIDLWVEKPAKIIENYFARNIENKWINVKSDVTSRIMRRSWKVSAKHKDILIEFAVVQLLRRFENMQVLGLSSLIDAVNKAFDQKMFDSSYEESHWLMQLYGYVMQKSNNGILSSIQYVSDNYQPCFLISPGSAEFITSDNPCYIVKDSTQPLQSGIYLPINPKVCLFLCNLNSYTDKNRYYIFDINDQNVKYINNQTIRHSIKELAYHSDDITDLVCNNIDMANWRTIPQTLQDELKIHK